VSIDVLWSMPKYLAHLQPVWDALPPELRGSMIQRNDRPRPQPAASDVAVVAGYLDMREARRRRYQRIALLEHGIGQTYGTNDAHLPGGDDRDAVGLFLSPNEHAARHDAARYPAARVAVVGSTVLDTLPHRSRAPVPVATHGRRTVAVTFHWHYTRVPEMRSAFEHFLRALPVLAATFDLIGHAHPQAAGMVVPAYRALRIEFEPSYQRVFERADLLIADNTSAIFEFASTGRPVVVLNAPEYRRDIEHGLRFWEAAGVGLNVWEPTSLVPVVDAALTEAEAYAPRREAALDIVYAFRSGAGQRAANALQEWIHA
jgi:hypothetical protein